jgi:hypothetical protein
VAWVAPDWPTVIVLAAVLDGPVILALLRWARRAAGGRPPEL